MKRFRLAFTLLLLAIFILQVAVTLAQETGSITTTFAGGNAFAGNMFDVTALADDITITGFDVHIAGSGDAAVEVYYRPGSFVGHEDSAAGWTLLGSDTAPIQGFGNPTPVTIGGLTIPQGETYGLYVNLASQEFAVQDLIYTNGANTYNNGDVEIITGATKGNPAFTSGTTSPQTWNGTIYYTIEPVPRDDEGIDTTPVWGPPCDNLFDGRVNDDQALDCAAPVAIYIVDGRVDVYLIDPNSGEGSLIISAGAPANAADTEASGNVLLGTSGNIRLYWLPATGEYLLQATYADGKPYEVVWSGDGSNLRHTTA